MSKPNLTRDKGQQSASTKTKSANSPSSSVSATSAKPSLNLKAFQELIANPEEIFAINRQDLLEELSNNDLASQIEWIKRQAELSLAQELEQRKIIAKQREEKQKQRLEILEQKRQRRLELEQAKSEQEYWQLRCQQSLEAQLQEYCNKYDFSMPLPILDFDLKSRNVAGTATNHTHISVNLKFLLQEKEDYVKNTIGHELAHSIVAYKTKNKVYGNHRPSHHGKEWKQTMLELGLEPKTYHNYDVGISSRRPYLYSCACEGEPKHYFSSRRHQNLQEGVVYRCRTCKEKLTFVRKVRITTSDVIED